MTPDYLIYTCSRQINELNAIALCNTLAKRGGITVTRPRPDTMLGIPSLRVPIRQLRRRRIGGTHRRFIGIAHADKILTLRYSKTTARPPACSRMYGTCCTKLGDGHAWPWSLSVRAVRLFTGAAAAAASTFFLSDGYGNELLRFSHSELSPRHRGMRSTHKETRGNERCTYVHAHTNLTRSSVAFLFTL